MEISLLHVMLARTSKGQAVRGSGLLYGLVEAAAEGQPLQAARLDLLRGLVEQNVNL